MTAINDAHCHFFSTPFFESLGGDRALATLGWDAPGSAGALADRWVAELDRHGVRRSALIASMPGDAASVVTAVTRHPSRFVGFFMVDPTRPDAETTTSAALATGALRTICLYPAMQGYAIGDARAQRMFDLAAAVPGTVVFVHCGVLSVGVRRKLGLPSPFDLSRSSPVALQAVATRYPGVPIIVPHFGAGMFREALMLADMCANVHFDTSSSNAWLAYHPGLTLAEVFRQALAVAGADRLLFGSDSSFFPRGWVVDVYQRQSDALDQIGAGDAVKRKILSENFDRIFPDGDR